MPTPMQMRGYRTSVAFRPSGSYVEDNAIEAMNLPIADSLADVIANEVQRQRVQDTYEDGGLVCFDKPAIPLAAEDWDFLNSLETPYVGADNNWVKKAKMPAMLAEVTSMYAAEHVMAKLGLTKQQAVQLQGIIRSVNEFLAETVCLLFPNYKVLKTGFTWRLTPTMQEEMHYDAYGYSEDENHKVRCFINLDDKPRYWGTSYRIQDAVAIYAERLKDTDATVAPNLFNYPLNKRMPWAEMPRNFFSFAPGSLWLVNSQIVAHEIIFGRKMIGLTLDVDHTSMADPEKRFQSVLRQALTKAGLRA